MKGTSLTTLAYVVGIAIGDGNLSNHNGRAVRLRVTCDNKYPEIIKQVSSALREILPKNKVSIVERENCVDVSCYSNKLEKLLGWKAKGGSKHFQSVGVPAWIKRKRKYQINCLQGLFQTDGCLYIDRGYKMINFVTIIPNLAGDVLEMVTQLGFNPRIYKLNKNNKIKNIKYTIRLAKDVDNFVKLIGFEKK